MTARFIDHVQKGTHAARPAGTVVAAGTLYVCSDHSLIYQSDGAVWATWATLGETGGVAALDAHLADTVDAHDASAISFTPAGVIEATDVQAALVELDAETKVLLLDLAGVVPVGTPVGTIIARKTV